MKYLLTWTEAVDFCGNHQQMSYNADTIDEVKKYYQKHLKKRLALCTNIKLISTQELLLDLLYENKTPYDGWGPLDS